MDDKCFCDRMYPDSNPDASCGDCPTRDHKPTEPAQPESVTDCNRLTDRAAFEQWMIEVHGYPQEDLVWQEKRNCYADYGMHLAWQAWQAAIASPAQPADSGRVTDGMVTAFKDAYYRGPVKSLSPERERIRRSIKAALAAQGQPAETICDLCHELWSMAQGPDPISQAVARMETRLETWMATYQAQPSTMWAVNRWMAEVSNRPLVNVHRRTLDDMWRQVIRHFGGDDVVLCGPRHDDLWVAEGMPAPRAERVPESVITHAKEMVKSHHPSHREYQVAVELLKVAAQEDGRNG